MSKLITDKIRVVLPSVAERAPSRVHLEVYERFSDGWNHFCDPRQHGYPSGLYEQLRWFEEAGLVDVDCFWFWCGHAIYGGFKP